MSILFSTLLSHIFTIIEQGIVDAEPALVAEIELLITKLESYLSKQSAAVAPVAPVVAVPTIISAA
jgi:hypothetical protein